MVVIVILGGHPSHVKCPPIVVHPIATVMVFASEECACALKGIQDLSVRFAH